MDESQILPLGWKGYFERFVGPILSRDRFFLGMVLSLLVAAAEAFALAALVPLHTVEPYVIQIDGKGRVNASGVVTVTVGRPTSAELTYWVGHWARSLFLVDPAYSREALRSAYLFTDGPAVGQMKSFLTGRSSPLVKLGADPALRTQVVVRTVRAIGPDEAYVVLQVKNLLTGSTAEQGVTLSYRLEPPKKVEAALVNPIGLHVTNFSLDGGT